MKLYHFRNRQVLLILCLLFTLMICPACSHFANPDQESRTEPMSTSESSESEDLFNMKASAERIQDDDKTERLRVSVSIEYLGDQDLHDLRYQFELNPEVTDYIGSRIISYESGDPAFLMTTEEKVEEYARKDIQELNGEIIVSSINHNANMSLTSVEELKELGLDVKDVMDILQYIKIKVKWNGGEEEQTVELKGA